jgi:hypothetical protein
MSDRLLRKTVAKNTWIYTAVSELPMQGIQWTDRYCVQDVNCKALCDTAGEMC